MLFNSLEFLVFLPLALLLFFTTSGAWRLIAMIVASYVFYGWWNPWYLPLIVMSTLATFLCARAMGSVASHAWRRTFLTGGIAVNLGLLFAFKYFNFVADSVCSVASQLGYAGDCVHVDVLLPVGISFYTFQALSYLIEVWRDQRVATGDFKLYALYHCYFPQLVAGPIERPQRLLPQLARPAPIDYDALQSGVLMIVWGLFLKVVVADKAAPYVDEIFGSPNRYSGGHYLFATFLFSYQIFCDFAGYSTIAIGAARLMGIELMTNFRRPYFASSIREFWQRWHISLSTWFRDYLYIPLGGNRGGRARHLTNLMLVFMISGMWHGASWTFLVWGALHGLALVLETAAGNIRGLNRIASVRAVRMLRHVWVISFVGLAWIFFRAATLNDAILIVGNLFSELRLDAAYFASVILPLTGDGRSPAYALTLLASIGLVEGVHMVQEKDLMQKWSWIQSRAGRWTLICLLAAGIAMFGEFGARSFIYFQF